MGRLGDLVVRHYRKIGLPEIWIIAEIDVPSLLKTLAEPAKAAHLSGGRAVTAVAARSVD
jgi:uncharacterized protein with HEPN domain